MDYPKVPPDTMNVMDYSRREWDDDLVREYMHIPKPLQVPDCKETWAQFQDIRQEWSLGRAIYKDRVVIVKVGRPARNHSVALRKADGSMRRLLDPDLYV